MTSSTSLLHRQFWPWPTDSLRSFSVASPRWKSRSEWQPRWNTITAEDIGQIRVRPLWRPGRLEILNRSPTKLGRCRQFLVFSWGSSSNSISSGLFDAFSVCKLSFLPSFWDYFMDFGLTVRKWAEIFSSDSCCGFDPFELRKFLSL